jgi:hypothetical protein
MRCHEAGRNDESGTSMVAVHAAGLSWSVTVATATAVEVACWVPQVTESVTSMPAETETVTNCTDPRLRWTSVEPLPNQPLSRVTDGETCGAAVVVVVVVVVVEVVGDVVVDVCVDTVEEDGGPDVADATSVPVAREGGVP